MLILLIVNKVLQAKIKSLRKTTRSVEQTGKIIGEPISYDPRQISTTTSITFPKVSNFIAKRKKKIKYFFKVVIWYRTTKTNCD